MKKTLLSFVAIALSIASCDFSPKFTVNGTVEGEQTGNAYLITLDNNQVDTLAKAVITDGKFKLTGSVETLTDAYIVIEGKQGATPIFIENEKFTATLNPGNSTESKIEGGGVTQELANQYFAINKEVRERQNKLSSEYTIAMQAKDSEKIKQIRSQGMDINEKATAKKDSLTKANSDSFVAAYMLESRMGGLNSERLSAQYELLGATAKASAPGKKIKERLETLTAVELGKAAPNFTLNTPEGKPLSLYSIKAKVKLIDFWASWCAPCRRENPHIVAIYKEYNKKGLEIIGVSLDSNKEAWEKAIIDDKLTWPQVSDLKGWKSDVAKLYTVNSIPHVVVLDENNVIVAKNLRGDALKAKIAEMLK